MGLLGSEGSLTPCLLMERTLKRYCSPLTRSNTGNRGDVTTMSRLASSQLLFPTRVWGNDHTGLFRGSFFLVVFPPGKYIQMLNCCSLFFCFFWGCNPYNRTGRMSMILEPFLNIWGSFLMFPLLSKCKWSSIIYVIIIITFDRFDSFITLLTYKSPIKKRKSYFSCGSFLIMEVVGCWRYYWMLRFFLLLLLEGGGSQF